MRGHHKKPSEERIFRFEEQKVVLDNFECSGYILDIGGGGEGVIGKLKGEKVVAIDLSKRELEGTPQGPLKVLMDARDLQFLDGTFGAATSFFTLMYIKGPDHEKVFREVFRVLKPGGQFLIWDAIIPKRFDRVKKFLFVPVSVRLPHEEISTGYGALWLDQEQDVSCYVQLAEKVGFEVLAGKEADRNFFLQLRKS